MSPACAPPPIAAVSSLFWKSGISTRQDLLLEVQTSAGEVDVGSLTAVLAKAAQSDDDTIRLTALRWLRTFVLDARAALLPRYALVLSAVLPALAAGPPEIVQVSSWLW